LLFLFGFLFSPSLSLFHFIIFLRLLFFFVGLPATT
jgi:hypothetical protein